MTLHLTPPIFRLQQNVISHNTMIKDGVWLAEVSGGIQCKSRKINIAHCWKFLLGFYGSRWVVGRVSLSFKIFGCISSRSNILLVIYQEWLFWLKWNKWEVCQLYTGWTMWPWPLTSPMTLKLDLSRSNFIIAASKEMLVWLMWSIKKANQLHHHDLNLEVAWYWLLCDPDGVDGCTR